MENTNKVPGWVHDAWARGYKEALLDVYCYMTGNPQLRDCPDRLSMIGSMVEKAAENSDRLELID